MFVAAAEGEAERFAAFWRGSQAQGRGLASRYVRVVKLLLDPCRSINLSLPIPPNRQTVPPATADASKHPRFREGGGRTLGWKNEGGVLSVHACVGVGCESECMCLCACVYVHARALCITAQWP